MGVLQRFERRLEGLVSGAFAKAFKSDVKPVEIAAALQRELDNTAQVVSRERSLAPNDFVVELGPHDYERLGPYEQTLGAELVELVHEHADVQRYSFPGPVAVVLEEQDGLGTGQFRIRSAVKAGVERPRQPAAGQPGQPGQRRPAAHLVVHGSQHPVVAPGLVIGRGAESDLRIDDPGISRRHAEIRVHGDGPDAQVVIVDLGSTNGTVVDGVRITQAPLSDGSRIVLGSTVVDVHRRARG